MFFGYATLAVAFLLSSIAAYYSVIGLTTIFPVMQIPVMIMGGALEVGKIISAMWLHRNWNRTSIFYKLYLVPSLFILMLLTSIGTFGFLSKAHSDQTLVSGDVTSKIALYDEKIKIARENIDANRAALKQLDASVDQTLSRSTTEQGAERSVQIRRQQGPERTRLLRDIETEQKKIAQLNEERAPIAAEVRKVEAEVGPIKYISTFFTGESDHNSLERAVQWLIMFIVCVFDPLALVLILAGTKHIELERDKKIEKPKQVTSSTTTSSTTTSSTSTSTTSSTSTSTTSSTSTTTTSTTTTTIPPKVIQTYLNEPFKTIFNSNILPQVGKISDDEITSTTTLDLAINGDYVTLNGKVMSLHVFKELYPDSFDNYKNASQ